MRKSITASISIIIICLISFLTGYSAKYPVYASGIEWENINSNQELVDAWNAYLKSRNIVIQGSFADAVNDFTVNKFLNIANTLGINIGQLMNNVKKSGNSYLFNQNAMQAYDGIFDQFLIDFDLEIGDIANEQDNTVYSGKYFEDQNGNGCLVYIINTSLDYAYGTSPYLAYGTPYIYTNDMLRTISKSQNNSVSFNIFDSIYSTPLLYANPLTASGSEYGDCTYVNNSRIFYSSYRIVNNSSVSGNGGNFGITYNLISNTYTLTYNLYRYNSSGVKQEAIYRAMNITIPDDMPNANVYITTNNNTINNNDYSNNTYTTINEDGEVENHDGDEIPSVPGDSGGGGTVTPPTDSGGTDGDITFPNFDFQLPEINWSLGDLSEKFPFSIPFDLIAFFTVLNAEPQAPSIDANIPFGSWYTWHFQADFSQFNNWASIIRNVEFIAFCIGLIYLTIRLVKG